MKNSSIISPTTRPLCWDMVSSSLLVWPYLLWLGVADDGHDEAGLRHHVHHQLPGHRVGLRPAQTVRVIHGSHHQSEGQQGGGIFSNSIKLMLERQKFALYQQEMLLQWKKITLYQQDMLEQRAKITLLAPCCSRS